MKLSTIIYTSGIFSIVAGFSLHFTFGKLGIVLAGGIFLVAVDTMLRAFGNKKVYFYAREI